MFALSVFLCSCCAEQQAVCPVTSTCSALKPSCHVVSTIHNVFQITMDAIQKCGQKMCFLFQRVTYFWYQYFMWVQCGVQNFEGDIICNGVAAFYLLIKHSFISKVFSAYTNMKGLTRNLTNCTWTDQLHYNMISVALLFVVHAERTKESGITTLQCSLALLHVAGLNLFCFFSRQKYETNGTISLFFFPFFAGFQYQKRQNSNYSVNQIFKMTKIVLLFYERI